MRIFSFIYIILCMFLIKNIFSQESDSLVLVALYNNTEGANWHENTNWLSTLPIDEWYGVTVQDGRVTELNLNGNNLTGPLPAEIGNLTKLEHLYLENNNLNGSIPPEIGNLSNLISLWCNSNDFSGGLPRELGQLDTLNTLLFYNNNLSGNLPSEMWKTLLNLGTIQLGSNNFSGSIPATITRSPRLTHLNLNDNQLSGNIPPEMFELDSTTFLWEVYLAGNQLTGAIPSTIGNIKNLLYLELNDNQLSGSIPSSLGNCSNAIIFDLYSNNLSGPIPKEIGGAIALKGLFADNNNLTGPLPDELGNLTSLETLNLFNNNIDGDFPATVNSLPNLKGIAIYNNKLSGLPDLTPCPSLTGLDVRNNRLTFEDLEPNIGAANTFLYSPQDSVGKTIDTTVNAGSTVTFSVNVGGENNLYKWFKEKTQLSGEKDSSLVLTSVTVKDTATYYCEITNTSVSGLTLYSRPIHLTIVDKPDVTSNPATDIAVTTATLNATINANGLETSVTFVWSTNSDLSAAKTIQLNDTLSGYRNSYKNSPISNLDEDTTYYYRAEATNNLGTVTGDIISFSTLPAGYIPTVTTNKASDIKISSAILNGTVNANGLETTVNFIWGLNSDLADATATPAHQSPVNGTEETAVSLVLNNLQADTTYYFQLSASNDKGTVTDTILSFKTLATGIIANTLQADKVTANGGRLRGSVNPNELMVYTYFQWSTDLSYNNIIATDQNQVNGPYDVTVTSSINSLEADTQYNYRVVAVFESDSTFGQNQILHTLHGPVSLNDPADTSSDLPVNVNFSWAQLPGISQYRLQVSSVNTFINTLVDTIVETATFETILAYERTFYWRVAAFDRGIIHTWSDVWSLSTKSFPDQISAFTSLSFETKNNPADYKATDYRLFGLPGNANLSLNHVFGTNENKEWTAYWDNGKSGSRSDYLESYTDNDIFRFVTGRAFWIIFNGSRNINENVDNAAIIGGNKIAVAVHNGWNIITNPYMSTIDWNRVQTYNGIAEPIHDFEGAFNTTSEMHTYKGYYFFNDPNLSMPEILIPTTAIVGDFPKIALNVQDIEWQSCLKIVTEDNICASICLGVSVLASSSRDDFDYHKPRVSAEIPDIYFERAEWDKINPAFARDIRPAIDRFERWSFKVNSGGRAKVQLFFTRENIPADYEIILADLTRQKVINMGITDNYDFKGLDFTSSFELMIGDKNSIEEELSDLLPKSFSVGHNFPNPFNPETSIPVSIVNPANIELAIFDVTGKMVKQLYNGTLEPGKHFFKWDGTNSAGVNLSSGIYIYRVLKDGDGSYSGKLILLK